MTRPSYSLPCSQELLDRGRLTLQAIQHHERAARYQAAAASLQAAMIQAENGHADKLHEWLELESHQLDAEINFGKRSLRIDPQKNTDQPQFASRLYLDPDVVPEKIGNATPQPTGTVSDLNQSDLKESDLKESDSAGSIESTELMLESSEHVSDPELADQSPWSKMETGAKKRLTSEVVVDRKPLDGEAVEPDLMSSIAPAKEKRIAIEVLDAVLLDAVAGEHRTKAWWKAPHIWVSLVVHILLVICLSIIVATVASEPKLLAIVSATVESDHVLLETPMEMISELESTSEPMQSMPAANISDIVSDVPWTTVPIESGSMPSSQASIASTIAGATSESAQASMAGSKMITGAAFFGVKATGNTFVYIVDSSPSMRRDGAFEEAKREIGRSLSSMQPKQRYFISFFGKEIDPMVLQTGVVEKYPVYAKSENVTKTIDWLNRVQLQKDGLPPNNALTEAIGMQPDGIFLLFDGDTKVDVANFLRKVNRTDDILNAGNPKVPIHVVHFFQEEFQKQMRQVAEENGGTYRFVPRPQRPSKK